MSESSDSEPSRFTLRVGRWYAAEFMGDEFAGGTDLGSQSSIRIDAIEPMKQGDGRLNLTFYHANYPDGVRDKQYLLRVMERGRRFLLARSLQHDPTRMMLIYEISW